MTLRMPPKSPKRECGRIVDVEGDSHSPLFPFSSQADKNALVNSIISIVHAYIYVYILQTVYTLN